MRLILLIVTLFIGGCSLTPFNPFADEPKLEVNAAVGKSVKQEKAQLKVEQGGQEAETISNDTKQMADTISNVTQNIPVEYLLILVLMAGWAIPDPGKCLSALIVTPCRGVADFILKLFGRSADEAKNQNSK